MLSTVARLHSQRRSAHLHTPFRQHPWAASAPYRSSARPDGTPFRIQISRAPRRTPCELNLGATSSTMARLHSTMARLHRVRAQVPTYTPHVGSTLGLHPSCTDPVPIATAHLPGLRVLVPIATPHVSRAPLLDPPCAQHDGTPVQSQSPSGQAHNPCRQHLGPSVQVQNPNAITTSLVPIGPTRLAELCHTGANIMLAYVLL